MKFFSFILAFALTLSCAFLASCGSDTESSSVADSSITESSVIESSDTEPKESILISRGCKYEVPGGKGYVVKNDQWPANYTADLTDGVANDKLAYDNTWFSFNSEPDIDGEANRIDGVGTVIIDLGTEKTITSVRTNVYTGNVSSIAPVGAVTVLFSLDGKEFTGAVSLTVPELDKVDWAEGTFDAVNARYVKVEYKVGGEGYHLFTNEIEIYGY